MKKYPHRLIGLFVLVMLIFCGCGKTPSRKQAEKVLQKYCAEDRFSGRTIRLKQGALKAMFEDGVIKFVGQKGEGSDAYFCFTDKKIVDELDLTVVEFLRRSDTPTYHISSDSKDFRIINQAKTQIVIKGIHESGAEMWGGDAAVDFIIKIVALPKNLSVLEKYIETDGEMKSAIFSQYDDGWHLIKIVVGWPGYLSASWVGNISAK